MTLQAVKVGRILDRYYNVMSIDFRSRQMANQPSGRQNLLPAIFTIIGFGLLAACASQDTPPTYNTVGVAKVASISNKTVCAPTATALKRILETQREDEFLRMSGVEARSAGWVGPVFLASSDRVTVLQFDSLQVSGSRYSSVPVARVRVEEIGGSPAADMLKPNEREGWIILKAIDRGR